MVGSHRSALRGTSAEFSEYRAFRQGDDRRRLDWKVLARTDRAVLRVTTERATLSTVFIIDASASMAFPEPGFDKWARTCELVVALASIVQASGDRVGLRIAVDGRVRDFPAVSRRDVVASCVRRLAQVAPGGDAPLAIAMQGIRARSRVVVLSDLLECGDETWRAATALSATGSEIHVVEIIADEELGPAARAMHGVDPERPEAPRLLHADNLASYRRGFAEWRAVQARAWRDAGAHFLEATTGEPAARAVRRLVSASAHAGTASR